MYHFNSRAFMWLACVMLLPMIASAQFTNCTVLPQHNATTVTDLRPNDIKVMMAMGDSITAGFGVSNAINGSYGVAFSMGGDRGAYTLANFFQNFNPFVIGASTGTYSSDVCYGVTCPAARYYPTQDGYDAAKPGAMVVDMVSRQISYLIRQINSNPNIDIQNDWKVMTIMVGMNDLCASCTFNLTYLSPDEYGNNLMATLERVRTSMPRTFVNLVAGFNISQAYDLSLTKPQCGNVSRPLFIQCDCLFRPENGDIRETIDAHITQFNEKAQSVATYYQRKNYDNFAVVFQPFAANTHISDLPAEFTSDLDCLHPSRVGQGAMATALWNNMLTPAALKKDHIDMHDTPICPDENTLLYTY